MRWRRSSGLLIALLFAPASPVASQERSLRGDADDFFDDVFYVWSSPFNASARDLEGLAVIAGIVGAGLLVDGPVQRWLDAHPASLPVKLTGPFREGLPLNHLGRTHVLAPFSAALWLVGAALDDDGLRDAGLGCMAAELSTTLSRYSVSYIVGRLRPAHTRNPYDFEVPAFGDHDKRSFPGGHAANITSCVAFWTRRFELGPAEPVMFAVATLIGFGRTVDGAHWTSDTLLGMSWGFAAGKAVAGESRKRENNRARLELRPRLEFRVRF